MTALVLTLASSFGTALLAYWIISDSENARITVFAASTLKPSNTRRSAC